MQVTPRNNDKIADIVIEPNGLKVISLELSLVILSSALKNSWLYKVQLWEDSQAMLYKKNIEISVIFYFI